MKHKIVISGGGTLGHIIPIIPVVKKMLEEDKNYEFYFIGSMNGIEKEFIEKTNFFERTFYLDSRGFLRKISLRNIITVFKYFKTKVVAKKILKNINPDLVIGMGGYVSASVVKAAIKLNIKTMINEQNSIYGFTNKLLKNKVDKVLLSFEMEGENYPYVGNPRTTEIYERFKKENPKMDYDVLIVGGSRGAEVINNLMFSLKKEFIDNNLKILLITGKKYYENNQDKIKKTEDKNFHIIAFAPDLPQLMFHSKVVITRCGATTISEIVGLRKPSILIPSPNVTANHQEKNALHLVNNNAALMIRENELNKERLMACINRIIREKDFQNCIISNLNFLSKDDSRELFIKEIKKILENDRKKSFSI